MSAAFVAVDWGTTNRRAWALDAGGNPLDELSDDKGILACDDLPAEVAALRARFAGLPLLMAGMIGSNRGWIETPYVRAPAGLVELARGLHDAGDGVRIVPGVAIDTETAADVMRGEEVKLLGVLAMGHAPPDSLVCLPGTHSKWAELEAGRIARFRTVMTGDIFAALKARSILSDLLGQPDAVDDAFVAAVDWALDHNDLTAELFAVRARVLLGRAAASTAASSIAGLLIGSDVRIGLGRARHDVVPVVGNALLSARYAAALARAGRETMLIDGDTAFRAGMRALAAAA